MKNYILFLRKLFPFVFVFSFVAALATSYLEKPTEELQLVLPLIVISILFSAIMRQRWLTKILIAFVTTIIIVSKSVLFQGQVVLTALNLLLCIGVLGCLVFLFERYIHMAIDALDKYITNKGDS